MRVRHVGVAVVELGDRAVADELAEPTQASGAFGDGHREQALALLAELSSFGDVTQAVEIHVGAAHHRREPSARGPLAIDPALQARHRERAGRLRDGSGVFEDVLDRGADLVGGDQHHLVDASARDPERLRPDLFHRHPVGEDSDLLQDHPLPRRQRRVQGRGVLGLDADDAGLRPQRLDVGGNAGDEAAASDFDEHRVERLALLTHDLPPHRALPGDDVLIVERRNEDHPAFGREPFRPLLRPVVRFPREHHLRPEPFDRLHLDARCRFRHDDEGAHSQPARGERHALRVIAGGGRDDPLRAFRRGERRELVVGASNLEREYRLKVLALEPDFAAEPGGELRGQLQRRLAGHVVDTRLEDLRDVIAGHGSKGWTGVDWGGLERTGEFVRRERWRIIAAEPPGGTRKSAGAVSRFDS